MITFTTAVAAQAVSELLHRLTQVDLRARTIELAPQDTKTDKPRLILLTKPVIEELRRLPQNIRSEFVFVNPETGTAWYDVKKMWRRACKQAGLTGLWLPDLRRSFVTKARRQGIPESVVMRMSGHKTRSVFERYNIVEEDDLREAARKLEEGAEAALGQDQDKAGEGAG